MKHFTFLFIFLLAACTLIGCATSHRATQVVERSSNDSLFSGQIRYDSIYIDRWRTTYQKADTVFLETTKLEYRYRLLRDTVYRYRRDSVPVIREVDVLHEVRYIPQWAKMLSTIGAAAIMIILFYLIGDLLRKK